VRAPGGAARRALPAVAGVAISVGLMVWAFRGVRLDDLWTHIVGARSGPLLLAIMLATATFPLRLVRWRLLLRRESGRALPAGPLWHAIAIGFMANNLLPFRAGELIRAATATRLANARFTAVLSSIGIERIFDALAVVALLTVALFSSGLPADVSIAGVSLAHAAQVTGAMSGAALLAAILMVAFPGAAERLLRRALPIGRVGDRIVAAIEGVRHGLMALRAPALLAGVVGWSLLIWSVNALAFYVGFKAFGIQVSYPGALLLQGVLVFGISVQLTPGYLGQFEAAIVAALALYQVPNDLASSYGLAFHATTFLPVIALGIWSLLRTPITMRDLRRPAP